MTNPSASASASFPTSEANNAVRNATEAGAKAADAMFDRVVQGAHETLDRLAQTAAPAVDKVKAGLEGASKTLHQRADQLDEMQREWVESLRCTVRENPLTTLFTALAVGVMVAKVAGR